LKFIILFFICGILTSLIFPPFFLTPIGFLVFPYIFYLLNHKDFILLSYKYNFVVGFFYGLGFFLIFLGWIKEPFLLDLSTTNYSFLSYFVIIYCSLYFGFIFFILKFFKKIVLKFIMLPSLIVIAEVLCANIGYGFPWLSFALVHSNSNIGTALIYYIGTYGLSFISIVIFLFPYIFISRSFVPKKIFLVIYLSFFFFFLILISSRSTKENYTEENSISVTIAQINFEVNQKLNKESTKEKQNYILDIIKENKSELLIFAENNYPYFMNEENVFLLQENLNINSKLVIGATRKKDNQYFNSLFFISKNEYQYFDKKILVPFGEFIPLRQYFNFMEFIAGTSDFSKGDQDRKINYSNDYSFIPVICYEIIYFWKLINNKNNKSHFIINITNDSWFGKFSGPYQHYYFSKLRAAELNKPLIRVSNNGISAIFDNYGKKQEFIELNKRAIKENKIYIPEYNVNLIFFHKIIQILIFLLFLISLIINYKYNANR
tara:strand:+ start:65 stop:1537 length:1473 start_codon:yes stop_codon:yes gene_type:complete